jgi:TatD DNase family protein
VEFFESTSDSTPQSGPKPRAFAALDSCYGLQAMIDTHCHLTDERLGQQLGDVLLRAKSSGVGQIITIGTSVGDSTEAVNLCASQTVKASGVDVRCAVGIHPGYLLGSAPDATETGDDSALAQLRDLLSGAKVAALGEIGLDYHYTKEPVVLGRQREVFARLLQLASEANIAVIIHNREATADTLAVMRDFPRVRAVFHCFTGSTAEAHRILEAGYYLGFTGVVTFKKSDELRAIAAAAPADRFLVETDAPWLSPDPVRKMKTNEPAFVMHVAAAVAAARNISVAEVDRLTTENARRLFRM